MKIDKMEKDELTYHVPVLLKESVDGMNIHPDGTYVDVTFGGAGHSRDSFTPWRRRAPAGIRSGRGCRTEYRQ